MERADEVRLDDVFEERRLHVRDARPPGRACLKVRDDGRVVDEHVDAPVVLVHPLQHPAHLLLVADVHLDGEYGCSALGDLRRDRLHGRDIGDGQARAGLSKGAGVVAAYPHRAAGDNDDLVLDGHVSS